MPNFWTKLNKPIFALAPMEEVTDVAFREMFARYSGNRSSQWRHSKKTQPTEARANDQSVGRESQIRDPSDALRMTSTMNPFVMYTEFVNVDGLTHPEGYKRLSLDLKFTDIQRPMVAQIWGNNPDKFFEAAKICAGLGFDGIDINMGCPQDKEIGQGTCAALIRQPELAGEIIQATIEGAKTPTTPSRSAGHPSFAGGEAPQLSSDVVRSLSSFSKEEYPAERGEVVGLPVSVKTRLGYSKTDEMENWVSHLLKFDIAALALHARTKQEKSKVPAHWEAIAEAVKIRDKCQENREKDNHTLIIGNGDIKSREEGLARIKETDCDGVMIARGAFGNPWIFREDNYQPTIKERLSVMLEHAELFEKYFSGIKSFVIMRKHFKAYASGFDGVAELRAKLMETKSLEETKVVVDEFLKTTTTF